MYEHPHSNTAMVHFHLVSLSHHIEKDSESGTALIW